MSSQKSYMGPDPINFRLRIINLPTDFRLGLTNICQWGWSRVSGPPMNARRRTGVHPRILLLNNVIPLGLERNSSHFPWFLDQNYDSQFLPLKCRKGKLTGLFIGWLHHRKFMLNPLRWDSFNKELLYLKVFPLLFIFHGAMSCYVSHKPPHYIWKSSKIVIRSNQVSLTHWEQSRSELLQSVHLWTLDISLGDPSLIFVQ